MNKNTLRKGQHVIAKQHGEGGDLIVGRIDSVRSSGHVTGVNLLTQAVFTKKFDVLLSRNMVCTKREAEKVVRAYQDAVVSGGAGADANLARKAARATAIAIVRAHPPTPLPEAPPPAPLDVDLRSEVARLHTKVDRLLELVERRHVNGASTQQHAQGGAG